MITVTIRTKNTVESMPVRDETRVKDVILYLFKNYTAKGIKYILTMRKNKELN